MPLPPFITENLVPLTPSEPPPTDGAYRWLHSDITTMCIDLVGTVTGAGDPISDNILELELRWLKWRIRHWQPSLPKSLRVDEAVRQLILETIVLLEQETIDRKQATVRNA